MEYLKRAIVLVGVDKPKEGMYPKIHFIDHMEMEECVLSEVFMVVAKVSVMSDLIRHTLDQNLGPVHISNVIDDVAANASITQIHDSITETLEELATALPEFIVNQSTDGEYTTSLGRVISFVDGIGMYNELVKDSVTNSAVIEITKTVLRL